MHRQNQFWSGRRVGVCGGTGFLGWHLVQQLVSLGARARVFGLPPPKDHPVLDAPVDLLLGDLRDQTLLRRALADCDVVFHAAGPVATWGPSLATLHELHAEGTAKVLAAAPPQARIVCTSSVVAIGACRRPRQLDENAAFNLHDLQVTYVHAKRAAERCALAAAGSGRDVVVVNPGYLLGPEDYAPSAVGRFCLRFWNGHILFASPGGLNIVDVRDVARGHLLAAERGLAGRRYILGGENVSLRDFLLQLAQAAHLARRVVPTLPLLLFELLARLAEWRASWRRKEAFPSIEQARLSRYYWHYRSGRAARELGFASRPLAQTLADTYQWFVEHGKVKDKQTRRGQASPRVDQSVHLRSLCQGEV